jgi:phosphoheptose isomerase
MSHHFPWRINVHFSGNSKSLIKAFAQAKEMGLSTIGFSGQTGGEMAKSNNVDICLTVETDSIHRVHRGYWVHKFGGNMCCIAR